MGQRRRARRLLTHGGHISGFIPKTNFLTLNRFFFLQLQGLFFLQSLERVEQKESFVETIASWRSWEGLIQRIPSPNLQPCGHPLVDFYLIMTKLRALPRVQWFPKNQKSNLFPHQLQGLGLQRKMSRDFKVNVSCHPNLCLFKNEETQARRGNL